MAFVTTPGQSFGVPGITLTTANAEGSALNGIRTDAEMLVFDTTLPADVITGTALVGSATTTARRDHVHSGLTSAGDVDGPGSAVDNSLVRYNGTTGKSVQAWTSNTPIGTDAGIISLPGQPAFSYVLSAGDLNVTGDGAIYTLGTANILTEVFDQSGETTTAGVFTPTVAGIYLLGCSITFNADSAVTAMDNYALYIVTTALTLAKYGNLQSEKANTANLGVGMVRFSALFHMAASSTAKVTFQVFDSTDTLDIEAGNTTFFGVKVG